ncbi:MAG: hypothetical protein KKA19_01750, partial [Candidatus Margulisbacteria bacterium]|nr:hypothetical protein [Candidatus Margulisiibacteriota bacterium]
PDIPQPRKPVKLSRREVRLAPTDPKNSVHFKWLHQKTNYMLEMMKFFPDFENLGYAGRTEDDEDALEMWDQYGEVATDEETENLPGHFGNVKRDTLNGVPYGYGMGEKFEEVHFTPNAGEFNHIDAEKGGFAGVDLLDCEQTTLANISSELWEKVKNSLNTENRSYYEIAMDNNGSLADYSAEDAYLLMVGMLESRTRVWLTMEELFGSFNEADDQKRIEIIDSWVSAIEDNLNPENIALFSVFLDSQESFINRLSAFYGGGTDAYLSYEDNQRIPNFYENLKTKVEAYRQELANAGQMGKVQELDELWNLWVAPTEDPEAYPNYQGYDWATTPGNILAQDDQTQESYQVVDQIKGLLPVEYKGLRDVEVKIRRPDGSTFVGNPYDHIWGTHIKGVFQNLIDKYINASLTASIISRRKAQDYKAQKEEYDNKVWDRLMWEKAMKIMQAKKQREQAMQAQKVKAQNAKMNQELKKVVAQALAKKNAEKKQESIKTREKIKVHGKEVVKKAMQKVVKGLKASKQSSKKLSGKALAAKKKAYQKIFGDAQKRMIATQRKRNAKFYSRQKTQVSQRRAVEKKRSEQVRAKMQKKNKD